MWEGFRDLRSPVTPLQNCVASVSNYSDVLRSFEGSGSLATTRMPVTVFYNGYYLKKPRVCPLRPQGRDFTV